MIFRVFVILLLIIFTTFNCAKRGRPTGGPKDSIAPVLVSARPNFETTNFKEDEIRIYFDEYIKLKDLNKQLIISPPMKYRPIITPLGTPSKYIKIKILDTLKENTTYTFNFGQSIVDNNEENPLRNFKYVFSTGDYIDSLKISGTIKDAFNEKADSDVAILLYELDESYKDSIIYQEKPLYVGNTLDSTLWEISNMKAGKYKLIALKDASKDYVFNPKQDKIGYLEKEISIPEDSVGHQVILFKETLPYRLNRPSEETKNRFLFGYEGLVDSIKINDLSNQPDFKSVIIPEKEKDTLNFWYKNTTLDSLYLEVVNRGVRDTITLRRRSKKVDSLRVSLNARGVLLLRDSLKLISNIPLESIDTTKIFFISKDSSKVNYRAKFKKMSNQVLFDFDKKQDEKYKMQFLPNAIKDFYGNVNDTLNYNFSTKKVSDYGTVFLTLQNVASYPIIVQLLKTDGELVEEVYAETAREFEFKNLQPNKYKIRIIYDDNKNGKWDTGNFLLKIQPEKVVYYPGELDVRANWEMPETFILK